MTRVLWIADKVAGDPRSGGELHTGGAELTDAAAIEACPYPITVSKLRAVTPAQIEDYDLTIVANAPHLSPENKAALVRTRRHVLFEHDLRCCDSRGNFPAAGEVLHRLTQRCLCRGERWRDMVASARGVVYLTAHQRAAFHANPYYPLPAREAVLGSSLFAAETLALITSLRATAGPRSHSAIVWSPHPIKGYALALEHCRSRGWAVREIRRRSYRETLELLARSERLVYLPLALEPAGRLPVEARLSGCEVIVDEHVGVAHEPLWHMPAGEATAFLYDGPARFWRLVAELRGGGALPPAAVPRPSPARARLDAWLALATVRRRPHAADHWLAADAATACLPRSPVPAW